MQAPQRSATPPGNRRQRSYEAELRALEKGLQRFRVDHQRFLVGDLAAPPTELREQLTIEIRRLRGSGGLSVAESFRLNTLEAQFHSLGDLFARRTRARELGETAKPAKPGEAAVSRAEDEGVVLGERPAAAAIESLYRSLVARRGGAPPKMDLERFRTHLGRQAAAIRAKTGCSKILFRLADEDGKLKLKAKPLRPRG